jgi:protein-tyrosine phosphatase
LEDYDLVYYMDASNARYLRRLFGAAADKCQPLLSRDVADPWYTGNFTQTWEDVLEGCRRILEECV